MRIFTDHTPVSCVQGTMRPCNKGHEKKSHDNALRTACVESKFLNIGEFFLRLFLTLRLRPRSLEGLSRRLGYDPTAAKLL